MTISCTTRVLLLAGSTEATSLARRLASIPGIEPTMSLAGRTAAPATPPAGVAVRSGGFGGIHGLQDLLTRDQVDAVIDATHPFAKQMPHHALAACETAGVPLLRVERPPWTPQPGDHWIDAADVPDAAAIVERSTFRRVLLTIGRQEVAPFTACIDQHLFVRSIDPPVAGSLGHATLLLARGPFTVDAELALLRDLDIDAIVSKNSGGDATNAKVTAARSLGLPIVMVSRPAATGGTTVQTPDEAISWLLALPSRSRT